MSEMDKRVIAMANATWLAIADDNLATAENQELERDVVIDIVRDADFMETFGQDKEAYKYFQSLSRQEQDRLMNEAFPHEFYF